MSRQLKKESKPTTAGRQSAPPAGLGRVRHASGAAARAAVAADIAATAAAATAAVVRGEHRHRSRPAAEIADGRGEKRRAGGEASEREAKRPRHEADRHQADEPRRVRERSGATPQTAVCCGKRFDAGAFESHAG